MWPVRRLLYGRACFYNEKPPGELREIAGKKQGRRLPPLSLLEQAGDADDLAGEALGIAGGEVDGGGRKRARNRVNLAHNAGPEEALSNTGIPQPECYTPPENSLLRRQVPSGTG